MKRYRIILSVIAVVLLIAGGLWLYWERQLPLQDFLPQEDAVACSLMGAVFEGHVIYSVDDDTAERIIRCLNSAGADRGPHFDSWHGDAFAVMISYTGETHPWVSIVVNDSGQILLFNGEEDKSYYFEGGEELYRQIRAIAEDLPGGAS